jgi:hypothetical protein
VRFQENCKTADFELCKKEGAQFCRSKIFNLYLVRVSAPEKIVTIGFPQNVPAFPGIGS